MSAQELIITIRLDDGSLAEARLAEPGSAEKLRKLLRDPTWSRKPLRVTSLPGDTAGHMLAADTLAVSIALEGDVEGHTMTLHLPSAEEARRLQKRLLITGVLAASIVAGAAGASAIAQQQDHAAPAAGPPITVPQSVDTEKVGPAITVPAQRVGPSVISPAKDAKDARASGDSTGTDSTTDSSPSGPGSRTTYPQ